MTDCSAIGTKRGSRQGYLIEKAPGSKNVGGSKIITKAPGYEGRRSGDSIDRARGSLIGDLLSMFSLGLHVPITNPKFTYRTTAFGTTLSLSSWSLNNCREKRVTPEKIKS